KVEIAIQAIAYAFAAERGETRVDGLAHGTELGISSVAERQHRELHTLEARSMLAHQLRIGARGTAGRLTLAPGSGNHYQPTRCRQRREIEIGHIDQRGLHA